MTISTSIRTLTLVLALFSLACGTEGDTDAHPHDDATHEHAPGMEDHDHDAGMHDHDGSHADSAHHQETMVDSSGDYFGEHDSMNSDSHHDGHDHDHDDHSH